MSDIIQQLKDAEKRLADAKATVERVEGRREQILDTLKKEYKVETIEDGKRLLADLKGRVAKMETRLEGLVKEITEELPR